MVEPGLSWGPNDTIGLPSSTMNWYQVDFAVIQAYDNVTGLLTLDRPLGHYHYGKSVSTGGDYSGIDMRNEVQLLSRNVIIAGNDTDAWGCQVVTSDFTEGNGEERLGRTFLSNVEIYNCSQYDTHKAALRFEGASGAYSFVLNSTVHHGLGIGMEVNDCENIFI